MYGAVLAAGNAERVLCGCAPVIAPVAAREPFQGPANNAALIAPALAALMPSNAMRSSSSKRSRTHQVKAACAPLALQGKVNRLDRDPWGRIRERLVCGCITGLVHRVGSSSRRQRFALAPVVHEEMYKE
jgi:hypothetical protein